MVGGPDCSQAVFIRVWHSEWLAPWACQYIFYSRSVANMLPGRKLAHREFQGPGARGPDAAPDRVGGGWDGGGAENRKSVEGFQLPEHCG